MLVQNIGSPHKGCFLITMLSFLHKVIHFLISVKTDCDVVFESYISEEKLQMLTSEECYIHDTQLKNIHMCQQNNRLLYIW